MNATKSLRPPRKSLSRASANLSLDPLSESPPPVDRRPLSRKSRSRSLMQRFTRRISSRHRSQEDLDMNSNASTVSCDRSDKVAEGYIVKVSSQGGRRSCSEKLSRFSRSCDHLTDASHDEGTSSSSGYRTSTENHVRFRKSGAVEKRLKKTANLLFGSGWNLATSSSQSGWFLDALFKT
uniref:SUN1 n=1 Tax=Steinernema glaseri TaxID=37863 RepID=A0A1I7Y8A1_9BILA